MIAWLISPLGKVVAGAAIVVILCSGAYVKGRADGKSIERAAQAEATSKAMEQAREIERNAQRCTSDPTCILPDPFRRPVPGVPANQRK